MQTQINAFMQTKAGEAIVKIFGYSSKGVPGLELHGIGKYGQLIKQKFIYLTRERGIKLPVKKFVICVEQNDLNKNLELEDVKWLEFPMLLMYWYLAGLLPINKLDDCLCSGFVNTTGEIFHPLMSDKILMLVKKQKDLKLISSCEKSSESLFLIETNQLLSEIPNLKIA